MRHMVDLACSGARRTEDIRTVADVGCDHGMLAMGLAVSGCFDSVIGIDVSERALQDGALALHAQLMDRKGDEPWTSDSVEFRVGSGLCPISVGEADILCIAGMGINTMLEIILEKNLNQITEIERVGCRQLILQPTNSRPRNLIRLYDSLHDNGWKLDDERIEYMSSRFYISSSFVKDNVFCQEHKSSLLPGSMLVELDEIDPMRGSFELYIQHHTKWLARDSQTPSGLDENDERWLRELSGRYGRPKHF